MRITLPILLLVAGYSASAATYYVSTNGNNGSAGTSSGTAWRTVQHAADTVVAGDTVNIAAGAYGENVLLLTSGSAGSRLLFTGAGSNTTLLSFYVDGDYSTVQNLSSVLVGGDSTAQASGTAAFYTAGVSNYFFNITCHSAMGICCGLEGTGCVASNFDVTGWAFSAVPFKTSGTWNQLLNNNVHDGNDPEAFGYIWGISNRIAGNTMTNIGNPNYGGGVHADFLQSFNYGGDPYSTNIVVENNVLWNATVQAFMLNAANVGVPSSVNMGGWIIRNNLFYNSGQGSFIRMPGCFVYNNAYIDWGLWNANPLETDDASTSYGSGDHCVVTNNIFLRCNGTPSPGENANWGHPYLNASANFHDYNYIAGVGYVAKNYPEAHGVNGVDPKFVSDGVNFHIQTTSPLKDVGATLSGFSTDAEGVSRPQGPAWDIGPYEFVSGGGNIPPGITTQPQSLTINVGQTATFSVTATGSATLAYQWQKGGAAIGGATLSTYSIANAQLADAGTFTVTVTNAYGTANSAGAVLTVNAQASRVLSVSSIAFGYVAVGATPTATMWVTNVGLALLTGTASVSGAPYSITGGASYSLTPGQAQQVTVRFAPVTKAYATDSIVFSDNTGNALVALSGYAYPVASSFIASDGLVLAPFQASGACVSQGADTLTPVGGLAVYGFVVSSAGSYSINTTVTAPSQAANSFFVNIDGEPTSPTMIWDIQPVAAGTVSRTVSWRGAGTDQANEFSPKLFTLTTGTHYIVVRGREAGTFLCSVSSVAQNSPGIPPTIVGDPEAQSLTVGQTASIYVVATGTAPFNYQWRKGGVDIAGATLSSYTISNAQLTDAGNYLAHVFNSYGSADSGVAPVTVTGGDVSGPTRLIIGRGVVGKGRF